MSVQRGDRKIHFGKSLEGWVVYGYFSSSSFCHENFFIQKEFSQLRPACSTPRTSKHPCGNWPRHSPTATFLGQWSPASRFRPLDCGAMEFQGSECVWGLLSLEHQAVPGNHVLYHCLITDCTAFAEITLGASAKAGIELCFLVGVKQAFQVPFGGKTTHASGATTQASRPTSLPAARGRSRPTHRGC